MGLFQWPEPVVLYSPNTQSIWSGKQLSSKDSLQSPANPSLQQRDTEHP